MDLSRLESNIKSASALLKSLSNEKRLQIVCILNRAERSVGALEEMVGLSQSALSQHLARLRRDGIVTTRRDAQTIYYSISNKHAQEIMKCLCDIFEHTKGH